MIGLSEIEKIIIEKTHLVQAFNFLKTVGEQYVEAVALFAGYQDGKSFYVQKVIAPYQSSYILEQGLMYAVDGEELHKINVWLYENKMRLIAQIHSHPQEAFHSKADDSYPIVETIGGISIVVPDFATGKISLNDWAIYRLSLNATWDKLSHKEVNSLFKII